MSLIGGLVALGAAGYNHFFPTKVLSKKYCYYVGQNNKIDLGMVAYYKNDIPLLKKWFETTDINMHVNGVYFKNIDTFEKVEVLKYLEDSSIVKVRVTRKHVMTGGGDALETGYVPIYLLHDTSIVKKKDY